MAFAIYQTIHGVKCVLLFDGAWTDPNNCPERFTPKTFATRGGATNYISKRKMRDCSVGWLEEPDTSIMDDAEELKRLSDEILS